MKSLGIDFGLKKVGLAIGISGFAEPLKVIRYKDIDLLVQQIKQIIVDEKIDKVVVGVSEGEMAEKTNEFVASIQPFIKSTIHLSDETLSTQDAIRMSIESGMSSAKRRKMEDAFAASVMLQNYLDSLI